MKVGKIRIKNKGRGTKTIFFTNTLGWYIEHSSSKE